MYRRKLLEKKSLSSLIISFLTTTLFEKNIETENHTIRVRDLSIRLGKSLMLSETILNNISILAVLHDIGKIAISDEILKKKDPLSRRELEILKKHPQIGANICSSSPHLVHVAELVLTHHEWFDGSGYPQGISGDNIPVESRIISITDAFDVMTHKQPYKQPISIQEAIEKIITGTGTQFDTGLVKIFLKIINIPIEDFKEVTFTSNSFQ
jgi:HD-GYP domain-containing protein (c-di-GMP phosphodiesterase class II)